jgi:hypothetical protein
MIIEYEEKTGAQKLDDSKALPLYIGIYSTFIGSKVEFSGVTRRNPVSWQAWIYKMYSITLL